MSFSLTELREWTDVIRPSSHIILVWLLAWLLLRSIRKLLLILKGHIEHRVDERRDFRRIETLTNVFRYAANIVIVGMAGMLTLGELGVSIAPILATAGVAGIAIGFGAQSLVKDFFSGLFLLIENQVSEGDIIEAAGKTGYVERVTLRHIRMRDYDGSVHFIPNGMITTVTNKSREYAFAVIDLSVPGSEDLDRVFALMRQAADELRKDAMLGRAILADIDIAGVEKLENAAVTIRCRLKVEPFQQWRIRREFLLRMKALLDTTRQAQTAK